MPEHPQSSPAPRFAAIDAARGGALLAMATYHAVWDLGYLRLSPENYALTLPGRTAAHLIAGAFLVLVGIGLVLMNGRGLRMRPTLARFVRIGGAAALITAATYLIFPDSFIFFGVLHCIAVSSVLALPFLFAPLGLAALAAALVIAAPHVVAYPVLDAPALSFLGLGAGVPRTNDYVPLFPWFGIVLAGLVLGRLSLPTLARSRLGAWRPASRPARAAAFAGRHSLLVYLVHQPVLLVLLTGLLMLAGPSPRAGLGSFMAEYGQNCTRTGGERSACRVAARCTANALRRETLWALAGRDFTPAERLRAQSLSQACYEAAEGTAPPP
ncbi:heparan-alpha-glucosaminide N-acetyltransferase [Methylobacterium nigriterrae]|uniref:heparan-alpha-glucosaminide N-acetyltransferase n=1 Tax=Methylobacterium nigriterrae TaxID=3127512 RepID=UPI003013E0B0